MVNSLNERDTLSIPFVAKRAGEYEVTLRYMSGSTGDEDLMGGCGRRRLGGCGVRV